MAQPRLPSDCVVIFSPTSLAYEQQTQVKSIGKLAFCEHLYYTSMRLG